MGRTPKHNDYHDLIKKFNDSNAAEQINYHFISVEDKVIKSTNSKHCNSSDTDYLTFLEQMVSKKYPQISNKPSTTKETEKSSKRSKLKIPADMNKYLLGS
jgi:hypothetical protein